MYSRLQYQAILFDWAARAARRDIFVVHFHKSWSKAFESEARETRSRFALCFCLLVPHLHSIHGPLLTGVFHSPSLYLAAKIPRYRGMVLDYEPCSSGGLFVQSQRTRATSHGIQRMQIMFYFLLSYLFRVVCESPTGQPTQQPSAQPSMRPSDQPTSRPSSQPNMQPSQQVLFLCLILSRSYAHLYSLFHTINHTFFVSYSHNDRRSMNVSICAANITAVDPSL